MRENCRLQFPNDSTDHTGSVYNRRIKPIVFSSDESSDEDNYFDRMEEREVNNDNSQSRR